MLQRVGLPDVTVKMNGDVYGPMQKGIEPLDMSVMRL